MCVYGVKKKLIPHLMNNFTDFDLPLAMGKLKIQCVTLTMQAGFNDVDELLECHDNAMSTDELKQLHKQLKLIKTDSDGEKNNNNEETAICELTKIILQNSLEKTEEGLQEFENTDCNRECSEKVSRMVKQSLAYYQLSHENQKLGSK
jgi:hypothetical protein